MKAGIRYGNQQYKCKTCYKYQRKEYKYHAYTINDGTIKKYVKEGVGIRSMSRLLCIHQGTIISRIKNIAKELKADPAYTKGSEYEVDELHTFIKKKLKKPGLSSALKE